MNTQPRWLGLACALLASACTSPRSDAPEAKLSPAKVMLSGASGDAQVLLDRDLSTTVPVQGTVKVELHFHRAVTPQRLRFAGSQHVRIEGDGIDATDVSAAGGWTSAGLELTKVDRLELEVTALAPDARLGELEVWGAFERLAPAGAEALGAASRDVDAFAFDDARAYALFPPSASLVPGSSDAGSPCAHFMVRGSYIPGTVRRAYLAYEAVGAQRPFVLRRSLNRQVAAGGFWLASSERERTVVDELDPAQLTSSDTVSLCLPDAAGAKVEVTNLRLVVVLDNGRALLDRESEQRLGLAHDGNVGTSQQFSGGQLELLPEYPVALQDGAVFMEGVAPAASASFHDGRSWVQASAVELAAGENRFSAPGATVHGVQLSLGRSARADLPSASIQEVQLVGSPASAKGAMAKLVLTYPRVRYEGSVAVAEHFGDRAYLTGWTQSPQGAARVEVAGARVDVDGRFSVELDRRKFPAGGEWVVPIVATFPDGTEVKRTLHFRDDRTDELRDDALAGSSGADEDRRYGRENQTAWGRIDAAKGGKVTLGTDVTFEAPPGAVIGPVSVGITRKAPEAVPSLEPGMINVTAPGNAGYRFQPAGQRFAKAVKIGLPFAVHLLPEGMSAEQVKTYFFDEKQQRWVALPRTSIDYAAQRILSETTHFTFMINAVLVEPEHPTAFSLNPNALKDIQAADPSAMIDLIAPPDASWDGTARLAQPIRLPPGRGASAPQLAFQYDSNGGTGWMGVGWDVSVPTVQVDTRFGAPFYSEPDSLRYAFGGEQLVPVGSAECVDGSTGTRFAPRVERSWSRIIRCGTATDNHYWESTDKDGTLALFGVSDGSRLASKDGDIGLWSLARVIDVSGNLTEYTYFKDLNQTTDLTVHDPAHVEPFSQLYLKQVDYSGTAPRTGVAALSSRSKPGAYQVAFELRQANGTALLRADPTVSARMGFKVVSRFQLGSIAVKYVGGGAPQIIREYALDYAPGAYGKQVLSGIQVYGEGGLAGGKHFYAHGFEYSKEPANAFGEPVAWLAETSSVEPWADDALTTSISDSFGGHAYAGVAFGVSRELSVGFRVGYDRNSSETLGTMIDINGDGLPDRVSQTGRHDSLLGVQFAHKPEQAGWPGVYSTVAPAGDPLRGILSPVNVNVDNMLGADVGTGWNFGAQAVVVPLAVNIGASFNSTESDTFLTDADGDGLVDVVAPGQVHFNQPRSREAGVCSADEFCFAPEKVIDETYVARPRARMLASAYAAQTREHVLEGGGEMLEGEGTRKRRKEEQKKKSHPTDAMYEWTAPFDGTVLLDADVRFAHPRDVEATKEGRDGVRVRAFKVAMDGQKVDGAPTSLVDATLAPVNGENVDVAPVEVTVKANDRLFFLVSTGDDLPIRVVPPDLDGKPQPSIGLEEVVFAPRVEYRTTPEALDLVGPDGAKLYVFDANADFRVAGDPMSVVQVNNTGRARIEWSFSKAVTSDGVRICVQSIDPSHESQRSGLTSAPCRSIEPAYSRTYAWSVTVAENAAPEVFDVPVTRGHFLVFRVESDVAIDPGAIGGVVTGRMTNICSSECRDLTSEEQKEERHNFEADPYISIHENHSRNQLIPYVMPYSGTLEIETGLHVPAGGTFAIRTPKRLFFKSTQDNDTFTRGVTAGEQVTFEAHYEDRPPFVRSATVSAKLRYTDAKGNPQVLDLKPHWTETFEIRDEDRAKSPFAGGYHGWRYGSWGGRVGEAFDPSVIYSESDIEEPEGDDDEKMDDMRGRADNAESPERRRARLIGVLVPRVRGTRSGLEPGLKPEPAYVSPDGVTFISKGRAHGGRSGDYALADGKLTPVAFDIGEITRASSGEFVSGGLSIAGFGVTLAGGSTAQDVDVLDLNGDGIIDLVSKDGAARVAHLRDLGIRDTDYGAVPLRVNTDISATVGMGVSDAIRTLSKDGTVKSIAGMFPVGLGAGANFSATQRDLVDVNGDGLPDQVRREEGDLVVRLNLGNGFAAGEDRIPLGNWGSGISDPTGDWQQAAGGSTKDELGKVATPDVLRRAVTVTAQGSVGFAPFEFIGATASWETSVSATQVMFTDVTGDGLPDYVRKGPSDSVFIVRRNNGYGFDPATTWRAPAWPEGVDAPRFVMKDGFLTLENKSSQRTATPVRTMADRIDDDRDLPDDGPGGGGGGGGGSGSGTGNDLEDILGLVLNGSGVDALEANGTHSTAPGASFVVTVPFTIFGFTIHTSVGGSVNLDRVSGFELGLMDINGDGFADHVLQTRYQGGPGIPEGTPAIYARLNQLDGANRLVRVTRPLGGSLSLGYGTAGNTVDLPSQRWVLEQVTAHDGVGTGTGHEFTTRYAYDGGLQHRAEREFLGFSDVTVTGPDGSVTKRRYDNHSYLTRGTLLEETFEDAGKNVFSRAVSEYESAVANDVIDPGCEANTPFFLNPQNYCGSFAHYLKSSTETRFEGKARVASDGSLPKDFPTTRQTFVVDADTGNVTEHLGEGDLSDPSDDLFAKLEYETSLEALNITGRVKKVTIHAGLDASGTIVRSRSATYDTLGRLSTLSHETGKGLSTSGYTWNENGTLLAYTAPPNIPGKSFTLTYGYDATETHIDTVTDVHGLVSTFEVDPLHGRATRSTDPNNQSLLQEFDDFGRLEKVAGPHDSLASPTLQMSYVTAPATGEHVRAITTHKLLLGPGQGEDSLETVTFVDGLGRVVQSAKQAQVDGILGFAFSGVKTFDAAGRVRDEGQPFSTAGTAIPTTRVDGAPKNATNYSYDALGRVTKVTYADKTTVQTSFDLAKVQGQGPLRSVTRIVDEEQRTRSVYNDLSNRKVAVEEVLATPGEAPRSLLTRYEYSRVGELEKVIDAANNETRIEYDLVGRRTKLVNPDTGTTTYQYDAAGNLESKQDENLAALDGASIQYVYDYDRLVEIRYPRSEKVVFKYGEDHPAPNGLGRITFIDDEAGSEVREYDALGNVSKFDRTVRPLRPADKPEQFTTQFEYDAFGRMQRLVYPDGEVLEYAYDRGGQVYSAKGTRLEAIGRQGIEETYVASILYDEFGQRTALTFGNGITTTYDYQPIRRRLWHVNTVRPGSSQLQKLTYDYFDAGSIKTVVNDLGEPVGKRAGKVEYEYAYDSLDRLTFATGKAKARPGVLDTFTADFEYSDIHDLTRKKQVRELVRSSATDGPSREVLPRSSHDWAYVYPAGKPPHQASRVGDTLFTYDANGNTRTECEASAAGLCDPTTSRLRQFVWNESNQLKAVVDGTGTTAQFLYDSNGDRVVKHGRGTSIYVGQFFSTRNGLGGTKHIFAGPTRIASKVVPKGGPRGGIGSEPPASGTTPPPGCIPSEGQPQKCEEPVVSVPGFGYGTGFKPATYYYHPDHLGSTSWVTDQFARVHERVEYFPYGEVWREGRDDEPGPPKKTPSYLFTGKEFDVETGLTYFGARYYDSRRVRWLSTDPLFLEQGPVGLNPYQYAGWEPLQNYDPNGKSIWTKGAKILFKKVVKGADVADTFIGMKEDWDTLTNVNKSFGEHLLASVSLASEILPVSGDDVKDGYRLVKAAAEHAGPVLNAGKKLAQGAGEALVNGVKTVAEKASKTEPGRVLLDSNVLTGLKKDPSLAGRIREGEEGVISYVSLPEMRNATVTGNLKGVPGAAYDLPVLQTQPSLDARINIRGMLPDRPGRFGDGIIGAQALENGLPLVTNDKALRQAVEALGGEVR